MSWNDQHEIVDLGHETPCWRFTGHVMPNGYGRKWSRLKKTWTTAIRAYWHEYNGEIPKGLVLDHLCRNPICVNPEHLEPVTYSENAKRGNSGLYKKLEREAVTHCNHGHEYTEENIYWSRRKGRTPYRQCRQCMKRYSRNAYEKVKSRVSRQTI